MIGKALKDKVRSTFGISWECSIAFICITPNLLDLLEKLKYEMYLSRINFRDKSVVDHPRQEHHIHPLVTMPRRPSTAASAVSLSRTQTTPYPLNRPLSQSTLGTGRPRTARPRTATSTTANDTNVIAAVTEGPYMPPNRY